MDCNRQFTQEQTRVTCLCSSRQPFPGCSDLSQDTCHDSCYQCCDTLQKLQVPEHAR